MGEQRSEGGSKSAAGSSFQKVAGLFDFCGETFLIWKGEFVFARQNLTSEGTKCQRLHESTNRRSMPPHAAGQNYRKNLNRSRTFND
jgi:hypothetical protein